MKKEPLKELVYEKPPGGEKVLLGGVDLEDLITVMNTWVRDYNEKLEESGHRCDWEPCRLRRGKCSRCICACHNERNGEDESVSKSHIGKRITVLHERLSGVIIDVDKGDTFPYTVGLDQGGVRCFARTEFVFDSAPVPQSEHDDRFCSESTDTPEEYAQQHLGECLCSCHKKPEKEWNAVRFSTNVDPDTIQNWLLTTFPKGKWNNLVILDTERSGITYDEATHSLSSKQDHIANADKKVPSKQDKVEEIAQELEEYALDLHPSLTAFLLSIATRLRSLN